MEKKEILNYNIGLTPLCTFKYFFKFNCIYTIYIVFLLDNSVFSRDLLVIFISVINQLDAQNFCFTISLFHASTCFENMCSTSEGKIALHSLWYHHTETSKWSKITKIQFYKYEQVVV